jgi:hypothetical protein
VVLLSGSESVQVFVLSFVYKCIVVDDPDITNINKLTNYLSPKESLNSDGQQFHQYQQSEQ